MRPQDPFNKKIRDKIGRWLYVGFFTDAQATEKGMRLVTGREGKLCLYWLVDEADGIIADVKFQAFGPIALIVAADAACELILRKNYDQASRISADLLDRHLRDRKEMSAFSKQSYGELNQVISAIESAVHQCVDIPYAASDYDTTPIEWDSESSFGGLPGWIDFPMAQKIKIIEEVVDKEIRPYVELDAGGVKILGLRDNGEVRIAYEGSCTTCHSSTGSTLSAIQKILKGRVHPSLTVVPE